MIAKPEPLAEVFEYARAVVAGSILTGRFHRLACQRHLDDLQQASARGFFFDEDKALAVLNFFPEILRHSIGELGGEPFELEPWQKFIIACLFGWQYRDGTRRFRKAYITIGRKNGKSCLCAGIAAALQYLDGEPGAKIYCAATKRDQADEVFTEIIRMVEQSPDLRAVSKICRSNPPKIKHGYGEIKALASDGGGTHGMNPHGVIVDELHAWREHHRDFKEQLESAMGARSQPLEIIITTAGSDQSQLWLEEDQYACMMLEQHTQGRFVDDRYFSFIARMDEDDDPFEEENWIKSNPNLGVSVKLDFLRSKSNEAKNRPTETNKFLRFHCNRRTGSHEVLIPRPVWDACDQPLTIQEGAECHGGIDIGRSNDWSAVAMVFPVGDEWEVVSRCWTCRHGGFQVDREPFRTWINEGLLECCDGSAIDPHEVVAWVVEQSNRYRVGTWAFDPAFAQVIGLTLQNDHGLKIFPFSQAPRFYNEATREFEKRAIQKRIRHGGDPVLAWQVGNMNVYRNHKDEWMPDKSNRESKIDGVVACQQEGRIVSAEVVDHIIPHRGDMFKFWDVTNWAPMCTKCHNLKTARGQ